MFNLLTNLTNLPNLSKDLYVIKKKKQKLKEI